MKLTGHKTESVYRRYAIVSKSDLEEATRRAGCTVGQEWEHGARETERWCEMKKAKSGPKSRRILRKDQPSIPISRDELFRLHDIADGLRLLHDITEKAPELQLIQAEILIKKTARCAWNLIHEDLDDRWQTRHPDVDLIRRS